jgi:hypothetical protein
MRRRTTKTTETRNKKREEVVERTSEREIESKERKAFYRSTVSRTGSIRTASLVLPSANK